MDTAHWGVLINGHLRVAILVRSPSSCPLQLSDLPRFESEGVGVNDTELLAVSRRTFSAAPVSKGRT